MTSIPNIVTGMALKFRSFKQQNQIQFNTPDNHGKFLNEKTELKIYNNYGCLSLNIRSSEIRCIFEILSRNISQLIGYSKHFPDTYNFIWPLKRLFHRLNWHWESFINDTKNLTTVQFLINPFRNLLPLPPLKTWNSESNSKKLNWMYVRAGLTVKFLIYYSIIVIDWS
jgi:hypothetical protein